MKYILLSILALSIANTGLSQTGPGGVGKVDGSSTLEYWIEANKGVTSSPITSVTDLSGNGVVNTILGDPTINSGAINGYNAMTFDGAGDYISTNLSINEATFKNLDVFAVYNFDGTSGAVWGEDNAGFDRFLVDADGAGLCNFATTSGGGCINDTRLFPASTPVISSVHFQEDVNNGSTAIVNGQTILTFSSNHGPEGSNNFDVGSIGTGNWQFNGDIAEVFVFSSALNSAQKVILHNYLSAKYNIPLIVVDAYNEDDAVNGNYDHEVFGIGRVNAGSMQTDAQGTGIVRILNPTGLDDNEFLMIGHDNGLKQATNTTDIPGTVQARFDRVWRASESHTQGAASIDVGAIDMRFDLTGTGAVTASDLRLLVDTNNNGLFSDETPISGATSLGGGVYQFAGVTAIADNLRFTVATINTTQTPLPIQLVSFSAVPLENKNVKLDWKTASELNNEYFTVERSINAQNWLVLETIEAKGDSQSSQLYTTLDQAPYKGTSYYRLKQTDFDGQFEYSQIRSVNIEISEINVYPNPSASTFSIVGNQSELREIKVYNLLGVDVTSQTRQISRNESRAVIDLMNLNSGVYFIKTGTAVKKVFKH